MVFLFNIDLTKNKLAFLSLTAVFGLGKKITLKILKKLGFSKNFKLEIISKLQVFNLIKVIKSFNLLLANDLKKFLFESFKNTLKIKLVKSFRRMQGLPVRGQRTHTNAKTAKKQTIYK